MSSRALALPSRRGGAADGSTLGCVGPEIGVYPKCVVAAVAAVVVGELRCKSGKRGVWVV
jgi:hypothetical protein